MLNNERDCNEKLRSAVHCTPVRCNTSIDLTVIYDCFQKTAYSASIKVYHVDSKVF